MTDRLPFDPDRMAAKKRTTKAAASDAPWSVSGLAARIDSALKSTLPRRVRVVGEISGLTDRTHWYFQLKDESAVIGGVMFASSAKRASFRPENGLQVVASGRIDFYAPSGRVSLIVDRFEPVGAGPLEVKYRALCAELKSLGWFEVDRKRALPSFARRIAVVTSRTGAALQDVIDTMRRRCPAVGLVVVDARVQGARAAPEVAGAIRALNARAQELSIDAILVTRGGGSMEDLWAFNEREVAEAIIKSRLPVVAAIGHETDTTIAELVADLRCATPTQAAMRLTPDASALGEQVDALRRRLGDALGGRLRYEKQRLKGLATRPVLAGPRAITLFHGEQTNALRARMTRAERMLLIHLHRRLDAARLRLGRHRPGVVQARREARLAAAGDRLRSAMLATLANRAGDVMATARELEAVSPMRVLARGYSVTTDADGKLVRSAGAVESGQRVRTRLGDGAFESEVVGEGRKRQKQLPLKPMPRRKRRGQGRGQMGLW